MISRRSLLIGGAGTLAMTALTPDVVFAATRTAWAGLRQRLHGELVLPRDAAYATARQLAYLQFASNPRAIAYCVDSADVALCLKFAQNNGLPFSVRSGGHSFGGYSTSRGLVIDVSRINAVTVGDGRVSLGPGAQMVDISSTLAPAGLAISGGQHPTVAAGGYLQGGGIGLLTRHIGIASDTVRAAQVVLANGDIVTASPQQHSDLYWAIRGGGGGNFGVVTKFVLTPTPISQLAVATVQYSPDHAVDMLDGYTRWLVDAPRSIGGAARVILADAAAGNAPTPVALLGSPGGVEELDAEVQRLISLTGAPVFQRVDVLPYQAIMMASYGCTTVTVPQCHFVGQNPAGTLPRIPLGLQRTRLFSGPVDRSVWEQAMAVFETQRVAGQMHNLEVLALGGAADDLERNATAYVHRGSLFSADFLVQGNQPQTDADIDAGKQWVTAGFNAIDPHSNGETYQNFIDPALRDWRESYYAENYPRLARIKAKYDPHRLFTFAQSIC
jgi:hypothetical protein